MYASCDVTAVEQTMQVVQEGRRATGMHVTGVMHLAGVLQDGLLKESSWRAFKRVVKPKVLGLRSLHRATEGGRKETILFSSITSMVGNMGQSNYAAANGFLDGFAEGHEKVLAIHWGAWEVGMYAQLDERLKRWKGLDGDQAMELLKAAFAAGSTQRTIGVMRMDWNKAGGSEHMLRKLKKRQGVLL